MDKRDTVNEPDGDGRKSRPATPAWAAPMKHCLQRIHGWRVPASWSVPDWFDEMRSVATLAAVEAAGVFDPARGTPFEAFVSSRVLARGLTFYRQEWTYATRHVKTVALRDQQDTLLHDQVLLPSNTRSVPAVETLREVLASLPEQSCWLLKELYLHERTEADIGRQLGISQRAVSKRKRAALDRLRRHLGRGSLAPVQPLNASTEKTQNQVLSRPTSRNTNSI
jgi:RNA polymerase sigma factor (sigma-70 family)